MTRFISAESLEKIHIKPVATHGFRDIGEVVGADDLMILRDWLIAIGWRELTRVAKAVRDERGIADDGRGLRFPTDELDPGEEPFEGVEVFTPMGEVHVDPEGFHRLMARFCAALIEGVTALDHSARREPWWPTFVELAAQISAQAAAR